MTKSSYVIPKELYEQCEKDDSVDGFDQRMKEERGLCAKLMKTCFVCKTSGIIFIIHLRLSSKCGNISGIFFFGFFPGSQVLSLYFFHWMRYFLIPSTLSDLMIFWITYCNRKCGISLKGNVGQVT